MKGTLVVMQDYIEIVDRNLYVLSIGIGYIRFGGLCLNHRYKGVREGLNPPCIFSRGIPLAPNQRGRVDLLGKVRPPF